jgi:hypothetical protein
VRDLVVEHADASPRRSRRLTEPIERLRIAVARIQDETRDRPANGVRHDDADGVTGTIDTDDAINFDPFPMLALMQASQVNYAVIGQVAGILHGSTELTGDLDILWDGDDVDGRLARALDDAGVVMRAEDGAICSEARNALQGRKAYFEGIGCAGDLCTPALPWGDLDIDGFLRRRVRDADVQYLSLEDLIAMRRAANRPRDVRRNAEFDGLIS